MVSFDVLDGILSTKSRERDSKIVAKRADFTTLVCEVIDELAVFTIFASECLFQFEYGSGSSQWIDA